MEFNPEINGDIEETSDVEFANKVSKFRKRTYALIFSRIREILPHLIYYKNLPESLSSSHMERLLRYGNCDICIGEDIAGNVIVIGIALSTKPNYLNYPIVQRIKFIEGLENQLLPEDQYVQITPYTFDKDGNTEGNYVLIRNRFSKEFFPEISIIEHYAAWLAEVKASRFSLGIQAKAVTVLQGSDPENNNRLNKIFSAWMNGDPGMKLDTNIDLDSLIKTLSGSATIPSLLLATKNEDNNIMNEMQNMLGIQNLGVEKEAGVSIAEATSNNGLVNAITNIGIESRRDGIELANQKWSKKWGKEIEVGYNNDINLKDKTLMKTNTKAGDSNAFNQ